LIAGREKDERAISLATPYYDVVRQKHGESDEEEEAANEVAVDYLTHFLPLVTGTRTMNRQEAMEVRERSLKVRTATLPLHLHTACSLLCCITLLCYFVMRLLHTSSLVIITCVRLHVLCQFTHEGWIWALLRLFTPVNAHPCSCACGLSVYMDM